MERAWVDRLARRAAVPGGCLAGAGGAGPAGAGLRCLGPTTTWGLASYVTYAHIHANILTQARGGGGGERGPLVAAAASYGGQYAAAAAAAAPSFLFILYILDSKEKEKREGK